MDSTFQKARVVNAIYGDNYGGRKAPNHPEWLAVAGDKAAHVQASFPTPATQRYFRSRGYNRLINNFVSTGNLGQEPRHLGDTVELATTDDFTPRPVYESLDVVGAGGGDYFEYLLAGGLILGVVAFIMYVR